MAIAVGYLGQVVSWGTGVNTHLISTGGAPASFSLSVTADEFGSTVLDPTVLQESFLAGLRSATGTIECLRPTPATGHNGSVTFSGGYAVNLSTYDINLSARVIPATAMGVTATTNRWKQTLPGLISGTFSYTARMDDTTAIPAPGGAPATATFTLASGLTIAGSAFVTSINPNVVVDGESLVQVSGRFTGALTVVGSTNFLPASVGIARPLVETLVLKTVEAGSGDKTISGSAYWTSLRLQCPVDAQITQTIGFQMTGELTFA